MSCGLQQVVSIGIANQLQAPWNPLTGPLGQLTAYNGALPAPTADVAAQPQTLINQGIYLAQTPLKGKLLALRFVVEGTLGQTFTGRISLWNQLVTPSAPNTVHWTKTQLVDFTGEAGGITGFTGGLFNANARWAAGINASSDNSLPPAFTRVLNPAGGPSTLVIDPMAAEIIEIALAIGTCARVGPALMGVSG
jgi:hypothetical protein